MINGHGEEYFAENNPAILNFSSTVWYGGDTQLLFEHLIQLLPESIQHYPEADGATLRKMIARRHELSENNIVITNGPVSAFYLIAQAFAGKKVLIPVPSFSEYEEAMRLYDFNIRLVSNLAPIEEWPLDEVDFCFLSTPNNPDGRIMSHAELIRLVSKHPKVNFIIDQAYANYTTTNLLKPGISKQYPNIITVWSFSHTYSIPGLRIGYIVANKNITEQLSKYLIPWSVNTLAIEAAKYILIHPAQFTLPIRKWQRATQELMSKLRTFDDLEVIPSETTFFLVRLKKGTAAQLRMYLLNTHNILIRDASGFHGLNESYVRITARDEEKNNILVGAIEQWLNETK
ncbi:aminotransferase class I/II-fold pyridoxal phosphate-dependent enzyme [Porphyromonas circumdentaria]|uniref:aminotransferase class I/II-fold pyridoxal phosphate-dependent enzyme n=1 Tax=Porphyromonas circumdentaria TaxID=29524 RepID=UPI0026DDC0A3|nr:aminotransferase class I/II-fold pyridoxal phosphate-dependent enzyme [Porphyromonas circumdentaria]MDO4721800.1 aminotransferase class I/II-fold pyridoxal phosphate-dependent enzyme [Porphyromonas circumdentaria]